MTDCCPVSMSNLAYVQARTLERTILNEFLGEGADIGVTITNLEKLLEHLASHGEKVSPAVLFNARRALVSLNNLANTMGEFVV